MPPSRTTTQRPAARRETPAPVPVERGLAKRAETEAHPLVLAIEQRMPAITPLLPASMDPLRFQSIVISAVVQNPDLLTCDPASVIDAVITAAREGLEPTGASGGAWLVPFYDKGVRKAQLIRDYRGIAKLLIGGGTVKRIDTSPVRSGDEFEYELGMNPRLVHKPKVGNDADAHSFYAIAWMPEGDVKVEVMTRAQVEHIRDKSKSRDREGKIVGPWATDFDQMGRKTVMKRLANNQLPVNHEVRAQLNAEDTAEFGDDGVVITRVAATDLTERRAKIADRTARLTGGVADAAVPPEKAADAAKAEPKAEAPEPSLDDAQGAAHAAAVKAGLVKALPADDASPEYAAALAENWTMIDGLGGQAIPDRPVIEFAPRDWLFVAERIAAGDFTDAAAAQ